MKESILIALEVYFIGFAIAILIATLIKVLQAVIRRFTPVKEMEEKEK